ncbi:MAG: HD domain-containing protein [Lachnospiraceae bacterium]
MLLKSFKEIVDPVDRAVVFATYAHKNVVRKGSSLPYILHPLEAGVITASLTEEREIIAAAILHDVVEDTCFSLNDICYLFGSRVSDLVDSNTEEKRSGVPKRETWRIRKEETINYLLTEASYEEKIIIFSDKLSNLRSTYNNYMLIGDQVFQRFNVKEKEQHKWYFESVLNAVTELKETGAYKEYENLLHKIF